jgi:hypothetical protein
MRVTSLMGAGYPTFQGSSRRYRAFRRDRVHGA